MRKVDVLIARFPWHGSEHPDCTDWLIKTVIKMSKDPRVGQVHFSKIDDTPITMGRNRAIAVAQEKKADYVLMLDADMSPDLPDRGARPFWDSSFDFALAHHGPCVVAAPYCGPPPVNNVYVFRWGNKQNGNPNFDGSIDQFTREESAYRGGFEEVAALPTGLMLIDTRAIERLVPPYFYYEWKDEREMEKASTEDVTFTRDLSLAGVPVYVNWDAWAGHWKLGRVDKPRPMHIDEIRRQFVEAIRRNQPSTERLVMVGEGSPDRAVSSRVADAVRRNGSGPKLAGSAAE